MSDAAAPTPTPTDPPRGAWRLPAILVLALALRAWQLQGQSLTSDEIIEASIARCSVEEIVAYPDGFPPLYHLLLAAWTRVSPAPETGRWLSVALGVAAVYAIYRWARDAVGPTAGAAAGLLLAVSPLHVFFSQELRAYSLYLCLAAFALSFFFEALRTDSSRSWLAFLGAATLAVYTHYYSALLAALLGVVLLCYRRHWRELRTGLAAFVALGVASIPALILLRSDVAYQADGFAMKAPLLATLGHTAYGFFAGFSLGPSLSELHTLPMRESLRAAAPWAAAIAPAALWLLWQGGRRLRATRYGAAIVLLALGSAPAIGVAGQLAGVGPKARYWSWILMPVIVWLAAAMEGGARRRGWAITWVALAVLIGVQAVALAQRYDSPRYANEDIRSVVAFIQQSSTPQAPVFVVADYLAPVARYYFNGEPTLHKWLPFLPSSRSTIGRGGHVPRAVAAPQINEKFSQGGYGTRSVPAPAWVVHPRTEADVRGSVPFDDEGTIAWLATVAELAGDDGRFWLLYSRPFHGDRDGRLLNHLQSTGAVQLERRFPGVELYRGRLPTRH